MKRDQLPELTSYRYSLKRLLGDDLTGVTAHVTDEETGESAFLRARNPDWNDRAVEAIKWEADILGVLDHQAVPRLMDADTDAPWPHLVTELMPYEDNADVDKEFFKGSRTEFAAEICLATLGVLEHVHGNGIVHRDLTRANILKQWSGEVALVDFEAAGYADQDAADEAHGRESRPHRLRFEALGQVWGTAQYMSPEQMAARHTDGRTDIYSMGVLFYELLYDRYPFDGENVHEICALQRSSSIDFTPYGDRHVPEQLVAVIDQATQLEPDARFQSAREMGDAVAAFLE